MELEPHADHGLNRMGQRGSPGHIMFIAHENVDRALY